MSTRKGTPSPAPKPVTGEPGNGDGNDDGSDGTLTPSQVLRALAAAESELDDWLAALNRRLVCQLPAASASDRAAASDGVEDALAATAFGRWWATYRDDPLLAREIFSPLIGNFAALRQAGLELDASGAGVAVPTGDYDALITRIADFKTLSARIRNKFLKAWSGHTLPVGVGDKDAMLAEMSVEYERAMRTGSPCTIALADIDHFARLGEEHGPEAGAFILKAVVARFFSCLRSYDSIFHNDDVDFAFCLPSTNRDIADRVMERLRASLEQIPIDAPGAGPLTITASFGFAPFRIDTTVPRALEQAGEALLEAKKCGRNRVISWPVRRTSTSPPRPDGT